MGGIWLEEVILTEEHARAPGPWDLTVNYT